MKEAIATLPQWWRARCRDASTTPALRHKRRGIWATVTWNDFFEQARGFGLAAAGGGLKPGDVVSILSENRPEWLFAALGAQAMGMVSHGIFPDVTSGVLADRLEEAGTRMLVVENAEQLEKALDARAACPRLLCIVVVEPRGLRAFSDANVLMYRDFTARGIALAAETGQQQRFDELIAAGIGERVAMLSSDDAAPLKAMEQHDLLHRLRDATADFAFESGDRSLSFLSLAVIGECLFTMCTLMAGSCLVHFPESTETIRNDLREVAPRLVHGPLVFWEALQAQTDHFMLEATPLARVVYRRALSGGSPTRTSNVGPCDGAAVVARRWQRFALRNVRHSLGLSSTRLALVSDAAPPPGLVAWYASIGVPLLAPSALNTLHHQIRNAECSVAEVLEAEPRADAPHDL